MSEQVLFGDSHLPDELDARVRAELDSGEQLLWVGQPRPNRFARSAIPIVLFGIPWTAFAIFWTVCASGILFAGQNNGPPGFGAFLACFPLFGLPFVLIGLWMLSSPFWLRRKAKRTCYALTDRRAIVWEAGWFGSVQVLSYRPAELTKIRRIEYGDGTGDLVFEETITIAPRNGSYPTTARQRHGFMSIDHVHQVEELLRKALLSSNTR